MEVRKGGLFFSLIGENHERQRTIGRIGRWLIPIGEFTFDCGSRQLLCSGEPRHLSPKAQQLLHLLLLARPRVLSREELYNALWPSTFVCETNLASFVNQVRRGLRDDARTSRYIRTVHGFGYAFCGEVSASTPALERATPLQPLLRAATRPERLLDIPVGSLSQIDPTTFLRQIIRGDSFDTQRLRQHIIARAEGNRFYVDEIVRMLVDRGGLTGEPGHWKPSPSADRVLREFPSTLRGLIIKRFAALPHELRHVLRHAAILAARFPSAFLNSSSTPAKTRRPSSQNSTAASSWNRNHSAWSRATHSVMC